MSTSEFQTAKQMEQVYQLLIRCGSKRTPTDFCVQLVKDLSGLLLYDQARVLFLDKSGKICDRRLFGVSEQQWKDFMYFYENDLLFVKHSLREPLHLPQNEKITVHNYWYDPEEAYKRESVFVDNYVRPLRIYHSMGIGFSDQENCIRSIVVLDRVRDIPFLYQEVELIKAIHPILENYYIDLLLGENIPSTPLQPRKQAYSLTKRESEIVELLMEGLTPTRISQRLVISVSTVYRHIANIYEKCHVTNRQELYRLFAGQQLKI